MHIIQYNSMKTICKNYKNNNQSNLLPFSTASRSHHSHPKYAWRWSVVVAVKDIGNTWSEVKREAETEHNESSLGRFVPTF